MTDYLNKVLMRISALQQYKKIGQLTAFTAKGILYDPAVALASLEKVLPVYDMFKSPFEIPSADVDGPLKIGFTEKGKTVGLYPQECHFLICGQTGSGKTTLLTILFSQALLCHLEERIKCWLFSKSLELRGLLRLDRDLLVVSFNRARSFKINPLEPPVGTKPVEWASIFVDLWQAFRIWEGSKGFLLECLIDLYEKFSSRGLYPSLYDLYSHVKGIPVKSQRISVYKDGILTRLGALINGPLAPVLDCSQGHSRYLTDLNVIFEILYLNLEQQVFLTNYLITYLFYYKMTNETNARHWIALDDANSIFQALYEQRVDLGLPIIHHLLTTVRKNKMNIFACSQTPHQLGASIHSNSFAKIMFSLSNGKDIEYMQQSMGIRDKDQKAQCYKLKPRSAIVKFAARWQEPFLMTVPEVNA